MKNKTHFSLWVFDSDVEDVSIFLISMLNTKQNLLSFEILVSEFGKGDILMFDPGRHLASPRH